MYAFNLPIFAVAALCAAAVCLLWLAYIDFKKFLLPDIGNAILAFCGVVFHGLTDFMFLSPLSMIIGSLVGGGMFIFARWYGFRVKKVEAVGLGDVKFAAAAGVWLGPFGIGVMATLSAFGLFLVGLLIALIQKRSLKHFYVPYGVAAAPTTLLLIMLHIFYKPLENIILPLLSN